MPALQEQVRREIEATPTISTRRLVQRINISHTSTYCMMRSVAFPYKLTVCQELKPADAPKHLEFCKWLLTFSRAGAHVFDTFIFQTRLTSTSVVM